MQRCPPSPGATVASISDESNYQLERMIGAGEAIRS